MADEYVQREYTVYKEEDGREYFLQPQGDNIVQKIYLDEQPQEQPETGSNIIVIDGDPNNKPSNNQEVLLVPRDQLPESPPPSPRSNQEPVHVIYKDPEPENSEPQTIYVTEQPPNDEEEEQPRVIYIQDPSSNGKLEPVEEEKSQPHIIYVQEEPEEKPETPQTVYIHESPPQRNTPSPPPQPQVIYLRDPPEQSPLLSPEPKQRKPVRRSPPPLRSKPPSVSPRPKYEPKQKSPPKYQPRPKPDQTSVTVGGMLIIDNDPWKPIAKVDHRNPDYKRSGGNVPIMHDRLAWDEKPRVDDWNDKYKRGGGNVVILHENLKWRKNAKRFKRPSNNNEPLASTRSLSSDNVRQSAPSPIDTLSEGAPSRSVEPPPVSYNDYPSPRRTTGSYSNQFKGKIHRYRGGPKDLPPVNPKDRHVLRPDEVKEILQQDEKQEAPTKRKQKPKDDSPRGFKPSPRAVQKIQERPAFRLPSKKEPLPSINSSNNYAPNPKKPVKYVLPQQKQRLPWKEQKIDKISTKTLEALSTRPKPKPQPAYMDNYGGNYYDDYDDAYYDDPPTHANVTYKQGRKEREQLRNNNKYNAVQGQHQYPSRKRNQPVY